MKFLKSDQVYYSLDKDADYCARAVADLIRADKKNGDRREKARQEQIEQAAKKLGAKFGEIMERAVLELFK